MTTRTMEMRGRLVTHKEARESARRLINSHFHNPDRARCSIPARPDDDDLVVSDYILEQEASAEINDLAHKIALEDAESVLDSESLAEIEGNIKWMDMSHSSVPHATDPAIRYLELRGLLIRHPKHENWIRIAEVSE